MNGVYIREIAPAALAKRLFPILEQAGLAPAGDLEARPRLVRGPRPAGRRSASSA